jgi:hypothetical protein
MQISTVVPKQFQSVINSIQKMIFRLKAEQTDEDNHKAWCDQELSKTKTSLDTKNDKVKELAAKIKEATAKTVTLTTEIEAAQKMLSDIKKFQKEATEIRQTGKEENKLAIKDAVAAQKAITNAISVLQTFYKSSGSVKKEPWEFIQEPVKLPKNPATWDSSYTGVADPKKPGGIPRCRIFWQFDWLLDEFPRFFFDRARRLVESLQDRDCIRDCFLGGHSVLDCKFVLFFAGLANLCCLLLKLFDVTQHLLGSFDFCG